MPAFSKIVAIAAIAAAPLVVEAASIDQGDQVRTFSAGRTLLVAEVQGGDDRSRRPRGVSREEWNTQNNIVTFEQRSEADTSVAADQRPAEPAPSATPSEPAPPTTPSEPAPPPPATPSPSGGGGGVATGGTKEGLGTFFAGMGTPGGCGVPPAYAQDDNGRPLPFVALNTNSEFANGVNCGRWVEITLGPNCQGGGNSDSAVCMGGSYGDDQHTGKKIYGYTMDSCPDQNYWCQSDNFHLDISSDYLASEGLRDGWNGRKIYWKYMNGAAPGWSMSAPKFAWKDGTKWLGNGGGFHAVAVIYNVADGISAVKQNMGNGWENLTPLDHLGNMWVLKEPSNYRSAPNGGDGQSIQLEVIGKSGNSYGQFTVPFTCGSGVCGSYTQA